MSLDSSSPYNKIADVLGLLVNTVVSVVGIVVYHWQPQDLAIYFVGATVLTIIFQVAKLRRVGLGKTMVAASFLYSFGLLAVLTIFFFDRLYPTVSDYKPAEVSVSGFVYLNLLSLFVFLLYNYKTSAAQDNHRIIMYPVLGRLLVLLFSFILGAALVGITGSVSGYLLAVVILDGIIASYLSLKS